MLYLKSISQLKILKLHAIYLSLPAVVLFLVNYVILQITPQHHKYIQQIKKNITATIVKSANLYAQLQSTPALSLGDEQLYTECTSHQAGHRICTRSTVHHKT